MNVVQFIIDNYQGLAGIVMAAFTLYKAFVKLERDQDHKEKLSKYEIIKHLVPQIHDLIEEGVEFTETKKDDAFLAKMIATAKVYGINITDDEHEGIKALGSAEHNSIKMLKANDINANLVKMLKSEGSMGAAVLAGPAVGVRHEDAEKIKAMLNKAGKVSETVGKSDEA